MVQRVEWLKLQMRHGRPERLPLNLLGFLVFEAYYQLCALGGYRPRHVFLESSPEGLRNRPLGERRILLIWPQLPLSIRMLESVWPYANGAHAEFVPYTPEAAAAARASGRRVEIMKTVQGELRSRGILDSPRGRNLTTACTRPAISMDVIRKIESLSRLARAGDARR